MKFVDCNSRYKAEFRFWHLQQQQYTTRMLVLISVSGHLQPPATLSRQPSEHACERGSQVTKAHPKQSATHLELQYRSSETRCGLCITARASHESV